jgi:hypothetical protein
MAEFTIQIAGHSGRITSLFDSTKDYCRKYWTDRPGEFHFATTREDLVFEQAQLDEEARLEGFRRRRFTDPFLERTAIQRAFAEFLLDHDTLLFHGSALAADGQGYLFTAKSGTGKSTHTRLWRETFGPRVTMINDDKPFLRIADDGIRVCGAPWSGKHGLDENLMVPLRGICILHRGSENRIRPASVEEALPRILHECYHPLDEKREDTLRRLAVALAHRVPLWHMECTRDPQAAEVAYRAMSQNFL